MDNERTMGFENINIRKATMSDIEDLCALELDAWGIAAADVDELRRRLTLDANSMFVATINDKIVGSIICTETRFDGIESKKWKYYVESFGSKDEGADCLYIVSISALSNAPKGVARFMLKSMVDECAKRGLKYLAYGSRIPGYHLHSGSLSVKEYVLAVKSGKIIDPVLSIANLIELKIGAIIDNYYNDEESLNFGVIVYKERNYE